jgi:hypothetical protein
VRFRVGCRQLAGGGALVLFLACGGGSDAPTRRGKDGSAASDARAKAEIREASAAPSGAASSKTQTNYYGGIRTTSSADGTKFLEATDALIKRVLDPENATITDSLLDEGRLVEVILRQTDEPGVIAVEPEDSSYSGTLTFSPDAWNATRWTYDLRMNDGSTIVGTGTDNGEALLIEQHLVDAGGNRQTKIVERLPQIYPSVIEAKRLALVR